MHNSHWLHKAPHPAYLPCPVEPLPPRRVGFRQSVHKRGTAMSDPFAQPSGPAPRLAIFTDFDGTLVEIAETPDSIDVPVDLAEQIERLSEDFDHAFAVLTGREIADVDRYLSPLQLPIAGAHGAQRRRADGTMDDLDSEITSEAEAIAQDLEALAIAHPDLILEVKEGAVALHFRQAPELEDEVRLAM